MNKIIIVYDKPFQYFWDGNICDSIDETIDYILNLGIKNFDVVETPLSLNLYKNLYYYVRQKQDNSTSI